MTIDVSEGTDPATWPQLPSEDRVVVGGRTLWTGPFDPPVMVAQPNRWGIIEEGFPELPCVVECDLSVVAELPLPAVIVRLVDRTHQGVDMASLPRDGAQVMATAQRLAKVVSQVKGVKVAAEPFARTIPLLTPREPEDLIVECESLGMTGMRPLPGLGGGVAITARAQHDDATIASIGAILRRAVEG